MIDPIFVTGCARSGTSMTAGILHLCGAFGGEMSGPTKNNKRGMFENAKIRDTILKPYLTVIGVDPMGQDPLPDIDNLQPMDGLRDQVEGTMKEQGYKNGVWFYKGAKLCLIWPIWHEAFPEAKWVIVRRKDEDIIYSCMQTAFMRAFDKEEDWQGWVDIHKKRFEEMKKAGLDICEVWPTKFVEGNFTEIQSVVAELGLEWNDSVEDFIEPSLWSNASKIAKHS